jgi:cysteine desulfurase/selenocysteine lyase
VTPNSTTIDLDRARADTPACAGVHHLNNAGASPTPTPVLDVVVDHLRREADLGGYEAADEASDRIDSVYASIARLVGGRPDEIALIENATRAWDLAVYGLRFGPGDRILTARAEYASNAIALLQIAGRTGAVVEVIDDDDDGQISLEALAAALERPAALVALTHVPTNSGLVNPAAEVGRLARDAGVPYVLDACQSVGQMPIDVVELGCDVLTATGRKFLRGPRGTGFAWVRHDFVESIEPPMLDLHAATWTSPDTYEVRRDARRLENWESYVAGRLGLGAAADYALSWGLEAIARRVTELASTLRDDLARLPGVRVHDKGRHHGAIVTFSVEGTPSREVSAALSAARVNTSVTSPNFAQYDLPVRGLGDLVRASPHYFNDHADLDALVQAVELLVRDGRS